MKRNADRVEKLWQPGMSRLEREEYRARSNARSADESDYLDGIETALTRKAKVASITTPKKNAMRAGLRTKPGGLTHPDGLLSLWLGPHKKTQRQSLKRYRRVGLIRSPPQHTSEGALAICRG